MGRRLITQTLQVAQEIGVQLRISPLAGVIGQGYQGYSQEIPYGPTQSLTTVEIETQIASWSLLTVIDDYVADLAGTPQRVYLSTSALAKWAVALQYPGARPRTRITWVAGYGNEPESVPMTIRDNVLQLVAFLYDNPGKGIPPDLIDTTYRIVRL